MSIRQTLAGAVLMTALTLTAGCAATAPVACQVVEPPPELTCGAAADAAQRQFVGLVGVEGIEVRYDFPCPPGGRCEPPSPDQVAYVVATLASGEQHFVQVNRDEFGRITSDGPRLVEHSVDAPEDGKPDDGND